MVAEAVQTVNAQFSKRTDPNTGERIFTSVVRRSWALSGWIKGKPYSYKLKQIMDKKFSDLNGENAVSRIYRNTWMKRGHREVIQKVLHLLREDMLMFWIS